MFIRHVTYIKNTSLSRKLYASIITLIIIPLIVAAFIINTITTDIVRENTNKIAFETLKRTNFSVSRIIQGVQDISLTIISDNNVQELLKSYAGDDVENLSPPLTVNQEDKHKNLQNLYYHYQNKTGSEDMARKFGFSAKLFPLYQSMPFIYSISVSKNGTIVNQFGDILYKEDKTFFKEASALKGQRFWTTVYELGNRSSMDVSPSVISLIRVINDLNNPNRALGMERISIKEEVFCDAYSNINTWKNGEAHILNTNGIVISSTNKSLLNTTYERDIFEQALNGYQEGYFESSIEGVPHWIFYYKLKGLNWIVMQSIPDSQLSIQLNAMNFIIFISILFCLFFGILFSMLLNLWVVKPLMNLSHEMEKVKTGNFDVQINSRSTDEIGSVISQFIDMSGKVKSLIDEVYTSQIKEKEAELAAMQAQINPHFLYNTLDNIRWSALKEGASSAGEQIETLSSLFRHILSKQGEITTIGEEIKHLEYYLAIQKNRFKERLQVDIEVDKGLESYNALKLMLQPVVENSIEHGFKKMIGNGIINIKIEKIQDYIYFIIRDNGNGADEVRINALLNDDSDFKGFSALRNIRERIQLQFDKNCDLSFHSIPSQYTTVSINIPALLQEKKDRQ